MKKSADFSSIVGWSCDTVLESLERKLSFEREIMGFGRVPRAFCGSESTKIGTRILKLPGWGI